MSNVKEGDRVVPTPRTLSNPLMLQQLMRRTRLEEGELKSGKIKVRVTDADGHAVMEHPILRDPFRVHTKFFERAPTDNHP